MNRLKESLTKIELIRRELLTKDTDAVVIKSQPNFSWITSGGRGFVSLASENSCGSVIVTKDKVYLAANNIESVRLMAEEIPDGLCETLVLPWTRDSMIDTQIAETCGIFKTDSELSEWFKSKRLCLMEPEIKRYQELGANAAAILENVCLDLEPGTTELQAAGKVSEGLWSAGIEPITILAAADDRSKKVRHYVPTNKPAHNGIIISICARRYGLVVSATRTVAFTPEFAASYPKLLQTEKVFLENTRCGTSLTEILEKGFQAYNTAGLYEEWKNHHQGGLTGYQARELCIRPGCALTARAGQAFAWNPSALGAKCEDTFLLVENGLIPITPVSSAWPRTITGTYERPSILKQYRN